MLQRAAREVALKTKGSSINELTTRRMRNCRFLLTFSSTLTRKVTVYIRN